MTRWMCILLPLIVLVLGCDGGPKLAPVSGKVTLNGQPLAEAWLDFQPIATGDDINPGAGSVGTTDKDGRYTLKTVHGKTGAVVGKHRVSITLKDPTGGNADADPARGKRGFKQLPVRYNFQSELTVDVPAGGRSDVDFPLKSP